MLLLHDISLSRLCRQTIWQRRAQLHLLQDVYSRKNDTSLLGGTDTCNMRRRPSPEALALATRGYLSRLQDNAQM